MVAVQNSARDGKLPADVEISEALARVGAETLFASGQNLRRLLFDANVFFLTSDSRVAISIAGFRELFEDIAFVISILCPRLGKAWTDLCALVMCSPCNSSANTLFSQKAWDCLG